MEEKHYWITKETEAVRINLKEKILLTNVLTIDKSLHHNIITDSHPRFVHSVTPVAWSCFAKSSGIIWFNRKDGCVTCVPFEEIMHHLYPWKSLCDQPWPWGRLWWACRSGRVPHQRPCRLVPAAPRAARKPRHRYQLRSLCMILDEKHRYKNLHQILLIHLPRSIANP